MPPSRHLSLNWEHFSQFLFLANLTKIKLTEKFINLSPPSRILIERTGHLCMLWSSYIFNLSFLIYLTNKNIFKHIQLL